MDVIEYQQEWLKKAWLEVELMSAKIKEIESMDKPDLMAIAALHHIIDQYLMMINVFDNPFPI